MQNNDLKVIDLYNNSDSESISRFNSSVHSNYRVVSNYEKVEADFAWLDLMEDTIIYLDNILRNPNRFIVNEEEVVNVEKARRVTVETIKHLAKHTNFIQEIEDNGDVKPSKILNINKDESYDTYENRLIYTLINNMKLFIDMKEKSLVDESSLKDDKKCEYSAVANVGQEKIKINMEISAKLDLHKNDGERNGMTLPQRIEKLKYHVIDLTNTPVYISLAKAHVAKVIPPVKKTNLILKNTNFQYAMKLWDFLQNYVQDDDMLMKDSKVVDSDENLKEMFDDTFLLNYLTVASVDKHEGVVENHSQIKEEITEKMINKIIEINSDLPIEKIEGMIDEKLSIIKNKSELNLSELERKFNDRIFSFEERIRKFSFR